MPVFDLNPSRQGKASRALRHVLFIVSLTACSVATAQVQMPRGYPGKPPWADTASESNIYPVGDAIGVYTAVLDLYFSEGSDRPRVIVMHDTAEGRSGGPCPMQCPEVWLHKSKIKESTMLSFAKLSPKRPRIVPFGYRIPIAFLSYEQYNQVREAGRARPQVHQGGNIEGQEWEVEFAHRYPGAWGFIYLSKVGFDDEHTEALISVHFYCGLACVSDENIFLRKIEQRWVAVERVPNSTDGLQPFSSMRYRGPSGSSPSESEVLYPPASERPEGEDVAEVYNTVLDSLYSFHGEFPRRIVVTDWFPIDNGSLDLPHKRPIEASTLTRYKFFRGVRAPLYTTLKLRAPVSVLPRDSMPGIERRGKPLETIAATKMVMTETTPFWLGFRNEYPGAWGSVGFTRAAFNDSRTQALVFTSHACGQSCRNDDTWLVERSGAKWRIAERIPRQADKDWELDSLRYIGADADPRAYANRRIRGIFVNQSTGVPLPGLRFTALINHDSSFRKTNSEGRFELTSLPLLGGIWVGVPCQRQPMLTGSPKKYSSRPLHVAELPSHPGLDSMVTVRVDFRRCLLGRRAHALTNGKPAPQALASGYPDATDAAVYRALFDALYPSRNTPVVLFPLVHQLWPYEFQAELVRLTKQGIIDSTVAPRLAMLPKDSAWIRPNVSFGRPVFILGPAEQRSLEQQADEFGQTGEQRDLSLTGMVKEAYPGADQIISLRRISYNQSLTQAIVQFGVAGPEPWGSSETLILRKTGGSWRVVRRHVEKEETSGDMIAGRCEPVDAVPTPLRIDQLERFVGDADITVIPTSPGMRSYAGTTRYRFTPNDTLHRYYWLPSKSDIRPPKRLLGEQKLATVQEFDSTGKASKYLGELTFWPAGSTIAFFEPNTFDGWFEEFTILRISGRQFFGKWESGSGPTYPLKGYFCGRLR